MLRPAVRTVELRQGGARGVRQEGDYQPVESAGPPLDMVSERGDASRMDSQGRRRVNSDEFEPLTSRHEALGAGGAGVFTRTKRCCCAHWVEAVLTLWGLAMLFSLMGVNRGVNTPPLQASSGLNLAALIPTLEAFETELFTLHTTNLTDGLLLMSFPVAAVMGDAPPAKVIFGASYARGSYDDHNSVALLHYPAESTDETVFVFRLTENMAGVDVLREQLTLRTSDGGMETSLAESAPAEWITTLPVLEAGGGYVMTSAENFLTNGFYVTDIQPAKLAGMRLKLGETRAYPKNAGVTVEYQLIADPGGEPGNVVPISLRFSISALPSDPMPPRWGDERVGYFNTVYKDLGDHRAAIEGIRNTDLLDTEVTLINRRRMAAASPAAAGSGEDGEGGENSSATEPEAEAGAEAEPLTYYVDPSVPTEWREYMRAGVEAWRPAFEAAGLGGEAIRAVLPGEDAWPADYDAGDIRFNSITWAVDVDEVFALGPATVDPRTGEILHSGIVFTNGWIKSWSAVFEVYGDSPDDGSSTRRRSLSSLPHLPRQHGHHHSHSHAHHDHAHDGHHSHSHSRGENGGGGGGGGDDALLEKLMPSLSASGSRGGHGGSGSLRYHGRGECQEARMKDISMSLLPLVMRGGRGRAHSSGDRKLAGGDEEGARGTAPGLASDEILGAGLTDVVMHEVGHTLGLRHNFRGSTLLTLEELQDPTKTGQVGLTSSVMDYLPLNIVSSKIQGTEVPHYFTPRVGEYDVWAIKYGYTAVEGEELLAQSDGLKDLASEAKPFATDEDGVASSGMNPLASVFDLGKEPMDYWEDRLELVTELWPVLLERSTQQGEAQFQRYGYAAMALLRQVQNSGLYSTKYLGGFDISKQRRVADDTPGPIQLIAADRQRRALTLILRVVAGDVPEGAAAFLPAEGDFSNLATWTGLCEGLGQDCYGVVPIDVLSEVNLLRKNVLLQAFSLDHLMRLRLHAWAATAASADSSSDVLTVSELFESTTNAVWGDGGFASARAKLWQNWDLMLFWLDVLQASSLLFAARIQKAYGSAVATTGVPGDVTATAVGLAYSLIDTGKNLTVSDPAYGLHRAASLKLNAWEERGGTDGFLLGLLGAGG
ncbi:unnamed protein product [Pylaiella littoralis]